MIGYGGEATVECGGDGCGQSSYFPAAGGVSPATVPSPAFRSNLEREIDCSSAWITVLIARRVHILERIYIYIYT